MLRNLVNVADEWRFSLWINSCNYVAQSIFCPSNWWPPYSFISGPRLFLSAPMEIASCKTWFTDLWNYSIVPYMLEAVREGLQVCATWYNPFECWMENCCNWLIISFIVTTFFLVILVLLYCEINGDYL